MICCLVADSVESGRLAEIARACSPRVEVHGDRAVVFDATGLGRVIGTPAEIAREVQALAAEQSVAARVAIAATHVAAWLLAHERPGITVIEAEQTAAALGPLPVHSLRTLPGRAAREKPAVDAVITLTRWGLAR